MRDGGKQTLQKLSLLMEALAENGAKAGDVIPLPVWRRILMAGMEVMSYNTVKNQTQALADLGRVEKTAKGHGVVLLSLAPIEGYAATTSEAPPRPERRLPPTASQ